MGVTFLSSFCKVSNGKTYTWPQEEDFCDIDFSDIDFCSIEQFLQPLLEDEVNLLLIPDSVNCCTYLIISYFLNFVF